MNNQVVVALVQQKNIELALKLNLFPIEFQTFNVLLAVTKYSTSFLKFELTKLFDVQQSHLPVRLVSNTLIQPLSLNQILFIFTKETHKLLIRKLAIIFICFGYKISKNTHFHQNVFINRIKQMVGVLRIRKNNKLSPLDVHLTFVIIFTNHYRSVGSSTFRVKNSRYHFR